jgi:histidinol dehydrogenase
MRLIHGFAAGQKILDRRLRLHMDEDSPAMLEENRRLFGEPLTPQQVVSTILGDVRTYGDSALRYYTRLLEGFEPLSWEIPREEWRNAYKNIPRGLQRSLKTIAERVRKFHQLCLPKSWVDLPQGFGELFNPLERVGIYIPGGRGAYPSTVLMTAIPARVAGVDEVILTSPGLNSGLPSSAVMAAAHVAGVDRLFAIGGAQGIGAMAFGTESVPQVDMICGPGNLFVTLAKQMVYGQVAIDGLYGPTEAVLIADENANPDFCAADVIAQAEHDPLASSILITTSELLIPKIERALKHQMEKLSTREVAQEALQRNGIAVVVEDLEEALALANQYAPEHLGRMVADPWKLVSRIRHAGGVFVGQYSPEVMGDYVAGPSHVMPTNGTARFSSPLGVHHFLKVTSLVAMEQTMFQQLVGDGVRLARSEGFDAHAAAMTIRQRTR